LTDGAVDNTNNIIDLIRSY